MKVMIFSGAVPKMRSGVGDYVGELAKALRGRVDLSIITTRDAAVDPALCPGARVLPIVERWGLSDLKPIAAAIAAESPDLFHQQYPSYMGGPTNRSLLSNLLAPWLKWRWPKKPLVTTFHEYGERRLRWRARAFPNLRWSDALITITERDREILSQRKSRVHQIPIGSSIPVAGREGRTRTDAKARVAYFGFLEPLKGFERFIQIAALMGGKDYRFEVIGGFRPDSNPYHRALRGQVEACGMTDDIRFLGHLSVEEVARCLAQADCCLFPFEEGVSERRSSFLAAVVQGTPMVTTLGPFTPASFRSLPGLSLFAKDDVEGMAAQVAAFCRGRPDTSGLTWLSESIGLPRIAEAHLTAYAAALAS
jgi:glycosyltransferase involved in cell wall biosynthesis